jgi:hypothetical protein
VNLSKLNVMFFSCNVLLLGAGAYLIWQQRSPNNGLADAAPPDQEIGAPGNAVSTELAPPKQIVTVTNEFRWRQLESEDYRMYIDRLRSIGCPEETIRDIVISDLDKLMAPRLQAANGRRADLQFWHSEEEELANDRDLRDVRRTQREVDREKRAVIEELLGVDLVRERMRLKGEQDYYERRMAFLPEARRTELRKVLERFDELEQGIREKEWEEGVALSAQERAQLRKLRQERQAEIDGLLSPEEREQYALWMSESANAVRSATYGMDITKEEFLAIYEAQKAFDQQWTSSDFEMMDEGARQRWNAARQQMETDLQRQLGTERFAEYKRGQDPDFHQLSAAATRFKLPKETSRKAYDVKRAFLEIRETMDANTALSPEQRQQALQAMQQESARTMRGLLGENAFRYYLRTGDGTWLQGGVRVAGE